MAEGSRRRRTRREKQRWRRRQGQEENISICWNAITNVRRDEDDQLNVTTTMIEEEEEKKNSRRREKKNGWMNERKKQDSGQAGATPVLFFHPSYWLTHHNQSHGIVCLWSFVSLNSSNSFSSRSKTIYVLIHYLISTSLLFFFQSKIDRNVMMTMMMMESTKTRRRRRRKEKKTRGEKKLLVLYDSILCFVYRQCWTWWKGLFIAIICLHSLFFLCSTNTTYPCIPVFSLLVEISFFFFVVLVGILGKWKTKRSLLLALTVNLSQFNVQIVLQKIEMNSIIIDRSSEDKHTSTFAMTKKKKKKAKKKRRHRHPYIRYI